MISSSYRKTLGYAGAGERSAIIYTMIESCRRRGIDPYAYLRDVFTRLPTLTNHQIGQVTPEAWPRSSAPPHEPRHHKRQSIDLSLLRFSLADSTTLSVA